MLRILMFDMSEREIDRLEEKILIIEGEAHIARILQLELEFEGYQTVIALTGPDGLMAYEEERYDLILLDHMLPEIGGLGVLQQIRAIENTTPIILLTTKNDLKNKIVGLDLGANDYVTKPFQIEQLLERMRIAMHASRK